MTDPALVTIRVRRADAPHLAWSAGREFRVPPTIATQLEAQGLGSVATGFVLPAGVLLDVSREANALRDRAAYTESPPASARLPVSYHAVPGWARAAIASVIGRLKRRSIDQWAAFPAFPLDLSTDFVADLARHSTMRADRTPVLVSHDIDSPEGLRNLVEMFLPLEEAVGARSSNYIVPCAWQVDDSLVANVRARGHEVGVHGTDHSNRTPFAGADERRERLDRGRRFGDRYEAIGYRAPSLLRTRALLADLESRYVYDSSIPTSGGLFPVPNNGCASARPFHIGSLLEIPVSMPRDGSLRFLGYGAGEIARMWRDCADAIASARGVVVLLTHCEARFSGNPPMLAAYRAFLEYVSATPQFRFSTPAELIAAMEVVRVH